MHWSKPTVIDVDMTIDIVVNNDFIGKEALRDRIVGYIGGTRSNGTSVIGTGAGDDVIISQFEDVVVGPSETGVVGISNTSFTPSSVVDSDGLIVIPIGDNEVANTNAQDSSITLNVTQR
jgi:hypothetical protein